MYVTAAGEEEPDYSCTIDVIPCYNTYYEPIFDSFVENIRLFESRKEIEPEIPGNIEFAGENQFVKKISYRIFHSERGDKYDVVLGAMVFILKTQKEEVEKFLGERYISHSDGLGNTTYVSDESISNQILIGIIDCSTDENYIIIHYVYH